MNIRVQKKGGDYATIAQAVQAAPYEEDTTIFIGPGVYEEKLFIEKKRLHLLGAGASETVIRWGDYAKKRHADGRETGTFRSYTAFLGGESIRVSGMTIQNSAGYGPDVGQAMAVYADARRIWMEDVRLLGRQDTLFLAPLPERERLPGGFYGPRMLHRRVKTTQYFKRCYIAGDIDFIFGGGNAVFDECQIVSLDRGLPVNGYIAAPSGSSEDLGFVFRDCRLLSQAAAGTVYLARPWRAFGKVAYLHCYLGAHIRPVGWHDWDNPRNRVTAAFGEYHSQGPGASPASRAHWARPLTDADALALNAQATALARETVK